MENIKKINPALAGYVDNFEKISTVDNYTIHSANHYYIKNNQTGDVVQFDDFGKVSASHIQVSRWLNRIREIFSDF